MRTTKDRLAPRRVRATLILGALLLSAAAPSLMEHASTAAPLATSASVGSAANSARDGLAPLTRPEIGAPALPTPDANGVKRIHSAYGKLPVSFEANRGQIDERVKFVSRSGGYTTFLTSTEAVFVFTRREGTANRDQRELRRPAPRASQQVTQAIVRMRLVGADPDAKVAGVNELPGKINYFRGNDPQKWRTNVPTYATVQYEEVYPGIDLVFYGNKRELEYDFVVRPGADPNRVALDFRGADTMEVDAQGDLVLHTAAGAFRQRKPVIYQDIDGARRSIAGGYVLKGSRGVGFRVAAYDATRPLVIDPALSYSTYLGGTGEENENPAGIAVDAAGNAYVTGYSDSMDFPTTVGAFQTTVVGFDAFVTKLDATGSSLAYSTYLGGNSFEQSYAIAVDTMGEVYVTGITASNDFPVTTGAFQVTFAGSADAFVTKLNATGSALVYSTYLGGSGDEQGLGIAVDATGAAYAGGSTASPDFPTTVGAFQGAFAGNADVFVAKLNLTGSALVYSTYLGGSGDEHGYGIAVDTAGHAYVTGPTTSTDLPVTAGAFQTDFGGGVEDGFVAKLNSAGSGLLYSTYLGGNDVDGGKGIAVDSAGNAYVTGPTASTDFPVTPGAFQVTYAGGVFSDVFVTKLNPGGTGLVYSTYLGGTDHDASSAIAVDAAGNAYVTGDTFSADFPTTAAAFQTTLAGVANAFVAKVHPAGSALAYSTYLGGSGEDIALAIAVDPGSDPNAYVTGRSSSTNFPTTPGAVQPAFGGGPNDAFVAKIAPFNTPASITPVTVLAGNDVTVNFPAVSSPGDTGASTSSSGPAPPAGFTLGSPPTYYDIQTTAVYAPPVSICITYAPAEFGDPASLRLFHFEGSAWFDVTTSNDTGTHVICGQVSSFSPFVIAEPAGMSLTALGPAKIWVGLKNSDDAGIRFDLGAKVYRNGTELVGEGEVASVPGGSSGFNNAHQHTITLTPVPGVTFSSGDTLSIKLGVRNACSGSGKNSGTARLWFNDSAANSGFAATIGNAETYFLRTGFTLATTPGSGPKATIDMAAGAKCSPYKTIGTWSTTLP